MNALSALRRTFLLFSAAMIGTVTGCAPGTTIDREAEIAAVERAIDGTIAWAKTKDFDLLYSIIANDSAYLEVHPEDVVVKGFTEFKGMEEFWASPDFRAIRHEIRDLQITLSRSGDVAWFFCMLDDINEWRGQPASWINTRWTGVLEKRDGRWVMVQMHFSNPVEG
ncbi:MAG: nuclear transport factor 2 family protein [Gemmatimonadota bacterium]|nr:MAG: nuclear transport factor 2 family protein [Gemmatimonadota bacterium]